jgi:hypothetical protein
MQNDGLALNDKIELPGQTKEASRIVAEEIARQVAFHIEDMFPEAVAAASSTFLLSVKGCIINEIMALKDRDKFYANMGDWLKQNDKHRRTIRKLKRAKSIEEVIEIHNGA